jgi:hypothetical protein
MMSSLELSVKGQQLVKLYQHMAENGYEKNDGTTVDIAFSDFELRDYRQHLQDILKDYSVKTILDYGCGGSVWTAPNFDENGQSAIEYFSLENAYRYEPARNFDERQKVDCVISFDVLEHVFIQDIPAVLRDMFSCAGKLIILNAACFVAAAKLPNGENAHITVRKPEWWKGMVDCISAEFPDVSVLLITSIGWRDSSKFPIWNANMWKNSETFVVDN